MALELEDIALLKALLDQIPVIRDVKSSQELKGAQEAQAAGLFSSCSSSSSSSSISSSSFPTMPLSFHSPSSYADLTTGEDLPNHWISIEALNKQGQSPFYLAVEKGNLEAAKLLFAKSACTTLVCGPEKLNVLHLSAERADLAMLTWLLQTPAATLVNTPNTQGNTALHLVAKLGHDPLVAPLLSAGARHTLKNLQDQTPMKLARQSNKSKTADFIGQTAQDQLQAKLDTMGSLQQRIEQLERDKKSLQESIDQLGRLQSKQFEIVLAREAKEHRELEQRFQLMLAALKTIPTPLDSKASHENASVLIFSKTPEAKDQKEPQLVVKPVDPKQLQTFLDHIARGRQDEAEAMLKANTELALASGDITDHAKRTFRNITGFQYAVWALDWKMWTMLLPYLSPEAAKEQAQGFKTGSWGLVKNICGLDQGQEVVQACDIELFPAF